MTIVCTRCGCAVYVLDRNMPSACALCGNREWQPADPPEPRDGVTDADQRFLQALRIAWPAAENT